MNQKEKLIEAVKKLEEAKKAVEYIHPQYGVEIQNLIDGMKESLRDEIMLENGFSGADYESYMKAEKIMEEIFSK